MSTLAGLNALSLRATLNSATDPSGLHTVTGSVHYQSFTVATVGAVQADILIGDKNGLSFATLTLSTPTFRVVADITLERSTSKRFYSVNGQVTDPATFNGMFSAFELTEIMDRSLQMR